LQNRQQRIGSSIALVAALALLAPAAATAWTWPVEGPVLQPFVFDELTPKAPGQHRGISIGAAAATPVRAPVDATITFAGTVPYGGKTLSLLAAHGLSVTLLHLGSFGVTRGTTVSEGQVVGSVGTTGDAELEQPFVYLGVRRVDDPEGYLDPMLFLPQPAVEPPPVEPPAMPAPVAPAPVGMAPPALAPPAPPEVFPRPVAPRGGAPVRPAIPTSAGNVPVSPSPAPHAHWRGQDASEPTPIHAQATTRVHAYEGEAETESPGSSQRPVGAPRVGFVDRPAAPTWLRPFDQFRPAVAAGPNSSRSPDGAGRRTLEPLGAALAALALALLIARRGRGGGARIIGGDALLPDNTDLLREREPAHRARVHDDRRGRARPAPQAAQ
jgi:hypothetical protein